MQTLTVVAKTKKIFRLFNLRKSKSMFWLNKAKIRKSILLLVVFYGCSYSFLFAQSSRLPKFSLDLLTGQKNVNQVEQNLSTTGIFLGWDINPKLSVSVGYLGSIGGKISSAPTTTTTDSSVILYEDYVVEETYHAYDEDGNSITATRTVTRSRPVTTNTSSSSKLENKASVTSKEIAIGGRYEVYRKDIHTNIFVGAGIVNISVDVESGSGSGIGLYVESGIKYVFENGLNLGFYLLQTIANFEVSNSNNGNWGSTTSGLLVGYHF